MAYCSLEVCLPFTLLCMPLLFLKPLAWSQLCFREKPPDVPNTVSWIKERFVEFEHALGPRFSSCHRSPLHHPSLWLSISIFSVMLLLTLMGAALEWEFTMTWGIFALCGAKEFIAALWLWERPRPSFLLLSLLFTQELGELLWLMLRSWSLIAYVLVGPADWESENLLAEVLKDFSVMLFHLDDEHRQCLSAQVELLGSVPPSVYLDVPFVVLSYSFNMFLSGSIYIHVRILACPGVI